jgi:hypothetical protein
MNSAENRGPVEPAKVATIQQRSRPDNVADSVRVLCFMSRPERECYADVELTVWVTVEERRFSAASNGL